MSLTTGTGLVLEPDVRLKMWIQQNYQYLESWCPLKRNCGTLVSAGDTEQFATQAILTPHYWQCSVSQCSDSSTIAKDLNADPGLSTPSSPVRFTGHEDHHQALHHPKNEQPNATDECVVTSLTSERVSRKPTTTKSCKSTSVLDLDPVFVLFVVAYNTIQYVDLSVLPSSLNIIWFQPFWNVFPPYWLLSILVDNKGCRRRRWIAACSILWVDDYIWRTLTSAALWTFALPQLDSARLQKLLTPVNLTKFVPGPESTGTPNQIPQQTTLPIHSGGSDFQGGIGGPSQSGQSGTGNSQFGGSRRPSGAGGPGGTGPNGREGGGAAGGGQRDGDGNEEPNRPEDLLWACHYYKRWPWKHFGCLHQPQKAPRYVKTHLLRKHLQPIHCTICHEAFGTHAEMNAHIVAMSCSRAMGPSPYCDAISNDQRDQLKTLQSAGESEVEKWYKIWDILFPGVQRPPSPYMTGDSSQQMCQFFDEEVYPLYEQTLLQGDVLNGGQIRYAMAVLRNIIDRRAAPPTRGHAPNVFLPQPPVHQQHNPEQRQLQYQPQPSPHNEASRMVPTSGPSHQPRIPYQPLRRVVSRGQPRNTNARPQNEDQRGHISPGTQPRPSTHRRSLRGNESRQSVLRRRGNMSQTQMSRTPSLNPTMQQQQQPLPAHDLLPNTGANQVIIYPGVAIPSQVSTQAPAPRPVPFQPQIQNLPTNYPPQNDDSLMADYTGTFYQYTNNSNNNNFNVGGYPASMANPRQSANTNSQMLMEGGYGSLQPSPMHNSFGNQGQRASVSMQTPEQFIRQLSPTQQMESSQEPTPGTLPGQTMMLGNSLGYWSVENLEAFHTNDVAGNLTATEDEPEAFEPSDTSQVGSPSDFLEDCDV